MILVHPLLLVFQVLLVNLDFLLVPDYLEYLVDHSVQDYPIHTAPHSVNYQTPTNAADLQFVPMDLSFLFGQDDLMHPFDLLTLGILGIHLDLEDPVDDNN